MPFIKRNKKTNNENVQTGGQTKALNKKNNTQMVDKRKENVVSLKMDDITTILGKGSEFEGKLNFEGTLRIEGCFKGEIKSDSVLVVDDGADISAEIEVGTIVIKGEVKGNIKAKNSIEIQQPGRVYGNLNTPALTIEKGVIFEGNCKMEGKGNSPVFTADDAKDSTENRPVQQSVTN